jgi:hypothetical protein
MHMRLNLLLVLATEAAAAMDWVRIELVAIGDFGSGSLDIIR